MEVKVLRSSDETLPLKPQTLQGGPKVIDFRIITV